MLLSYRGAETKACGDARIVLTRTHRIVIIAIIMVRSMISMITMTILSIMMTRLMINDHRC